MKGRTSVVIAHHLATIRHADVIFVVKDSELVEHGTHRRICWPRVAFMPTCTQSRRPAASG